MRKVLKRSKTEIRRRMRLSSVRCGSCGCKIDRGWLEDNYEQGNDRVICHCRYCGR